MARSIPALVMQQQRSCSLWHRLGKVLTGYGTTFMFGTALHAFKLALALKSFYRNFSIIFFKMFPLGIVVLSGASPMSVTVLIGETSVLGVR